MKAMTMVAVGGKLYCEGDNDPGVRRRLLQRVVVFNVGANASIFDETTGTFQ